MTAPMNQHDAVAMYILGNKQQLFTTFRTRFLSYLSHTTDMESRCGHLDHTANVGIPRASSTHHGVAETVATGQEQSNSSGEPLISTSYGASYCRLRETRVCDLWSQGPAIPERLAAPCHR